MKLPRKAWWSKNLVRVEVLEIIGSWCLVSLFSREFRVPLASLRFERPPVNDGIQRCTDADGYIQEAKRLGVKGLDSKIRELYAVYGETNPAFASMRSIAAIRSMMGK